MQISISINNREKVIVLPHLPAEIAITRPQGTETYQTTEGELNIIGSLGLKSISFESFLDDWTIVGEIEKFRRKKMPVRLIVTETPISFPSIIENFDTTIKRGKKIYYSISFKEFRFLVGEK